MSLDRLAEQDEFVRDLLIGDCPVCHSSKTTDCDNFLEPVRDQEVGACFECGAHWCMTCRRVIKEVQPGVSCPHHNTCANCSKEMGYLSLEEFFEQKCPGCEYHADGECQLDLAHEECAMRWLYLCPYQISFEERVSDCPTIRVATDSG